MQKSYVFDLPVDRDIMFADHKGKYKKKIEKQQRNLIVKIPFIKPFLEPDENILLITTGYSLVDTLDQILTAAVQESVDVIGLSIMTGGHIPICRKLFERMKAEDLADIRVVVGGVIPKPDIPKLKEMGAAGVFPGGTPFTEIVSGIRSLF